MNHQDTNKITDELGISAEGLGKEMRGWARLRQQHEGDNSELGRVLYSCAFLAGLCCTELLHLRCRQVLAAWNDNDKKAANLRDAIEAAEYRKFELQLACRNAYLTHKGIFTPTFVPTVTEEPEQDAPAKPEEQTTPEQTEQPEQDNERRERAIAALVPALLLLLAIAKRRKEATDAVRS